MTAKPTDAAPLPNRPLSPHLQVYRPQITSGISIFHRATGIGLMLGMPVFVAWLVVLAGTPEIYAQFIGLFHNTVGQILLIGWSWALFFHFCSGLRHLFWDAGYGLEIKQVYITGYLALAVSTLMTLGLWLKVYGVLP